MKSKEFIKRNIIKFNNFILVFKGRVKEMPRQSCNNTIIRYYLTTAKLLKRIK